MSEESEEFARRVEEMIDSRRDEAEQLKRANEEELRIRHGIRATLDEHGQIEAKTIAGLDHGAKRRGRIEKDINDQLEKILGKEQALQNRKQVLYEKELENYDYFIDDQQNLTKMLSKQNLELDNEQKKVLNRLRKEGISEERSKAKKAEVQKAQDEFGSNFAKGLLDLTKGLGNFATGLASGNTNFTSLNPLIDIVANSLASLAKAIPFVGEAIAGVTKAAAEGAKFVLELMDKNLKAFQELANAGALTAEGMEGVSRQFLESGMSLEGFKKAIRENAGDLAQWGKTVGGGADKFTKAVGMLTKSDGPLAEAGLELRKLGMTSDDIGTAAAGFLTQELRLGRARNMTEEQLAKGTAKYANELDALQKITGLSKEELIKQRNEMMSDSRFGASMDMLREENAAGAEAMMTFASTIKDPDLKRGFMDLASGAANTDAAKKAMVQMGSTVPDMIEKLKNAKPENVAKVFDETQTMLKKGAKEYSENFREAAAIMPDTKKLGNWTVLNEIAKSQNISMEEAIEVQKKQKAASGGLTEDTVKAQQNMERMGQEVWKMGTMAMPLAARAVNAFTKSMVELMKHINKILGKDPTDGELSNSIEDSKALQKQQDVMDDNIIAQKELKDAILLLKKAQTDPNKTDKDKAELQKAVEAAKTKANKTQLEEEEANKQSQITYAKKMEKAYAMKNEFTALNADRRAKGQEAYVDIDQAKAGGHKFKAEADSAPSGSKGAAAPYNAARDSQAANPTTTSQLADAGLKLKKGDVQADGAHVDPKLINIAKEVQATIPGFRQFTGFNDQYHNEKAPKSLHKKGQAFDFVLAEKPSKEQGQEIVAMMKKLGIDYAQDEYHTASAKSTGGHFHGQLNELKAYDGGVFEGPIAGYDVELHGREAIVPLPDPNSVISVDKKDNENVKKDPLDSVMNSIKSLIELPKPKSLPKIDKNIDTEVKKDPSDGIMNSIKNLIEFSGIRSLPKVDKDIDKDIDKDVTKDSLDGIMKSINSLIEFPDLKSVIKVDKDITKDVNKDSPKDITKDVNKDITKDVNKDINKDLLDSAMKSIKSLIELPNPKSISSVDKDIDKDIEKAVKKDPLDGLIKSINQLIEFPDLNSIIKVDKNIDKDVNKDPLSGVMNSLKGLIELPNQKSISSVDKDIDKNIDKNIDKDVKKDPLSGVMNSLKSLIELPNPKSISSVDKNVNEDVKKDPLASVMKSIKSLIELPDLKSLMNLNEGAKKEPLSTAMKSMNNLVELPDSKSLISNNEVAKKEPLPTPTPELSTVPLPGVDQLAGITQSMMQMMEDKFDEMISQLNTGNNISDKLLRNSLV